MQEVPMTQLCHVHYYMLVHTIINFDDKLTCNADILSPGTGF